MDETIITPSFTNGVTIFLMAAVGFAVIGFLAQLFHRSGLPGSASRDGDGDAS